MNLAYARYNLTFNPLLTGPLAQCIDFSARYSDPRLIDLQRQVLSLLPKPSSESVDPPTIPIPKSLAVAAFLPEIQSNPKDTRIHLVVRFIERDDITDIRLNEAAGLIIR